ncbi:MAG: hypothetical protein EOM05_00740 [Clostridia bacterium]|nr:hypothetical protein [Clostridia bacterium]
MEFNQGDKIRYIGSEAEYYGKIATISGIYVSKVYTELTFNNNGLETTLDDVPISKLLLLESQRVAGDFEVINAVQIGDKEIILGENPYATDAMKYLCSYCESNDLFATYTDALVSENYAEIVELFGSRISQQAGKTMVELDDIKIDKTPLSKNDCEPTSYSDDIDGKVIAIKTDVIRREYRTIDRQLFLVTGGNGSKANPRGSAVFCTNLYSSNKTRWERRDVLGVVKEQSMPKWAKENLSIIQNQKQEKQNFKEER